MINQKIYKHMEIEQCTFEQSMDHWRNGVWLKIPRINCKWKHNLPEPMGYKIILRGKFIAMTAYIKKSERSQINILVMHLKVLVKQK
jgi:hypothetical protein